MNAEFCQEYNEHNGNFGSRVATSELCTDIMGGYPGNQHEQFIVHKSTLNLKSYNNALFKFWKAAKVLPFLFTSKHMINDTNLGDNLLLQTVGNIYFKVISSKVTFYLMAAVIHSTKSLASQCNNRFKISTFHVC